MLIGLEALPDGKSLNFRARMMPFEESALVALDSAWRGWSSNWGERADLVGHTGAVLAVAFSPDGKRVLTGSRDRTAGLWDAATGRGRDPRGTHRLSRRLRLLARRQPCSHRLLRQNGAAVSRRDRRRDRSPRGTYRRCLRSRVLT
jgi:WD40 repeat protein